LSDAVIVAGDERRARAVTRSPTRVAAEDPRATDRSPHEGVVFHDVGDIRLDEVPDPKVREPSDAVVKLTASAICGTDLHFVRGTMAGMKPGTILGTRASGSSRTSALTCATSERATAW
jgi:hypothetical protein